MKLLQHFLAQGLCHSIALKFTTRLLLGLCILTAAINVAPLKADTVYITVDDFVGEVFHEKIQPSVIWLDKTTQADITTMLGHPYPQARLRYWRKEKTSVWVLDEIGKEYPITAGFVVKDNTITQAQVLIYRESRGMEIHMPGFLAQFIGGTLNGDKLSNKVDGISGATLSTNAMIKMARVALMLNRKTS